MHMICIHIRTQNDTKTGTFDKVDSRLACPSIRQEATGLATPGCIRGGDVGHSVPIVKEPVLFRLLDAASLR